MVSSVFGIHLAKLRSVKIVQKSVKSQGIIQLLMGSNPAVATVISSRFKITCYFQRYHVFACKLTWFFIGFYIMIDDNKYCSVM